MDKTRETGREKEGEREREGRGIRKLVPRWRPRTCHTRSAFQVARERGTRLFWPHNLSLPTQSQKRDHAVSFSCRWTGSQSRGLARAHPDPRGFRGKADDDDDDVRPPARSSYASWWESLRLLRLPSLTFGRYKKQQLDVLFVSIFLTAISGRNSPDATQTW